ncbi:Verru_Chthon cassette protein B [Prosthecobacter debontii]|uniref:Verru_Chthon cassette protein B n=1 Tax=Prosthecobacter debontii TaxID=48467 RepID=A0A1T4WTQ8_9BACT|nr:Verru_Chthon cassette protein B [Prosthecobacter debontii]SKA80716.1 Verru_Chthon cassette protein B [Prosthecobacter debontii]
MNIVTPDLRRSLTRGGFSLVEVVLAVGIMALGVVTILGLLPHGLEMTRKTANEQAETRIIDQIVGEMQSVDWGTLDSQQAQIRYFDDQGLEIEATTQGFDILLNYVVQVTIPTADVRLPTNSDTSGIDQNLRRVMIKMIAAPLKNFDFTNPSSGVPIKVFTQLVANTALATNLP